MILSLCKPYLSPINLSPIRSDIKIQYECLVIDRTPLKRGRGHWFESSIAHSVKISSKNFSDLLIEELGSLWVSGYSPDRKFVFALLNSALREIRFDLGELESSYGR